MSMKIRTINIDRTSRYDAKPNMMRGSITLESNTSYSADLTIPIPEELLHPIIAIVSQVIAKTVADGAKAFEEECLAQRLGAPIEAVAIASKLSEAPATAE
jgi:hypothetical protein